MLSKELPKLSTGPAKSPISEAVSSIRGEITSLSEDNSDKIRALQADLKLLESASEVDAKIQDLTKVRKQLLAMDLRDKHYLTGSVLLGNSSWFNFLVDFGILGVGVSVSLLGCLNTFLRAGKLYPGPHLFAGAAITGLWAVSAALVPAMQKGNEGARSAHIALNTLNIALFGWQVATGLDIMQKVWENTNWP